MKLSTFIIVLILIFSSANFVLAVDTEIKDIEINNTGTTWADNKVFATSFEITELSYLNEFFIYTTNDTYFTQQTLSYEIRYMNNTTTFHSYNNSEGKVYSNNFTITSLDQCQNKWLKVILEKPLLLEKNNYSLFVDLLNNHPAGSVRWLVADVDPPYNMNTSLDAQWLSLPSPQWDYANVDGYFDFTLKLNISTAPINSSIFASNINAYYDNPTNILVAYTDFVGNNIVNATVKYEILGTQKNGTMQDTDGDGIYTAQVTIDQISPFTINFTANRSGFKSTHTTSTITVNKRPTEIQVLTDPNVMRGDTVTFQVILIDSLTGNNLTGATLKYTYTTETGDLVESDSIYQVNLSILEYVGTRSITFNATKPTYQYISYEFEYEIYTADLIATVTNNQLLLYFENPITTESLRSLQIEVKIFDANGVFVTSEILDETNEDGYYILNLEGLISEGDYSFEINTYNNGNLVHTQSKSVTYSDETKDAEKESFSLIQMLLLFLLPTVAVASALLGKAAVKHRRHMQDIKAITEIVPEVEERKNGLIEVLETDKSGIVTQDADEVEHELFDEDQDIEKETQRLPKSTQKLIDSLQSSELKEVIIDIPNNRYSTGISTLDVLFECGLPKKSTALIVAPSSDEKEIIIENIFDENIDETSCIYVGHTLPAYLDHVKDFENFFAVVSEEINAPNIVTSDSGPTSIGMSIAKVLNKTKTDEKILIIEMLTDFISTDNMSVLQNFVNTLKNKAKTKNMSTIAFINSKTDEDLIEKASDAFDGEIRIENGGTNKTISVIKFSCIEHAEGKFELLRDAKDLYVDLIPPKFSREFERRIGK